jgi:hypothetical protein
VPVETFTPSFTAGTRAPTSVLPYVKRELYATRESSDSLPVSV